MRRRWLIVSVVAGLGVAGAYTATPLTICATIAAAALLPLAYRGLGREERRWLTALLIVAAITRAAAISVTLVRNVSRHDDQFVGAVFGDEAYVMSRALRVRDIIQGTAVGKYDFFIAYDEYGRNSYVTIAAVLQVIFGPTPYSLRLLNAMFFVAGAILLFRLCRSAFGALPAFLGLAVVLFWPTLFAWSISLLKEPLYFLGSALVLTSAVHVVRAPDWRMRVAAAAGGVAAALLIRDLRPAALILATAGLGLGAATTVMVGSRRRFALGALAAVALLVVSAITPAISQRFVAGLEAAAKTHSGHVFTVGHSYKLLDPGFYVNPAAPSASKLTLTPDEAARFVLRAASSFFLVPMPWQLQSVRELAYLPEQIAWYLLVLLVSIGAVAGCRRDPLVTCMLLGYAGPTAAALALTNGNVGTLLRLRGLVIPYCIWIGAVGFCAMLETRGRNARMPFIDDDGRLFGRFNLVDAAFAGAALVLIPLAYGTFLLFRAPTPRITSVERVPITAEERRVAGGSRLTAKLKVRGSGLNPLLRAVIGDTPSIGFVFEDPNSADVLVGDVPAGTHDLVLYDGVQEVARRPGSVTVEALIPLHVTLVGTFVRMDQAAASTLSIGALTPNGPTTAILKLGAAQQAADGWQRGAEIQLPCDPDPHDAGCAVGGVPVTAPFPILRLAGPAGSSVLFAPTELFPASSPAERTVVVRLSSAPELVDAIKAGDRDDSLDDRAATIVAVGRRRENAGVAEIDVTMHLGVDGSPDGWRYRGRLMKAGAPFTLTTERYVMEGLVLSVAQTPQGGVSR